jgi:hypothetical protein
LCPHVFQEIRPILLVARNDGDFQLLCGEAHDGIEGAHWVHTEHVLDRDPSLREVTDLPDGWEAERANVGSPWIRIRSEA